MNPGFILVLSFFIQLITGVISKAFFPSFVASPFYEYIQIPLSTLLSIFLPSYLYLKYENKDFFTDFCEDTKPDKLMLLCVAVGLCTQFISILVNMPVNLLLSRLSVVTPSKLPASNSINTLFASLVSFALFPALFEEILFRGIIFNYFRQYGNKAGILISSLLFSMLHFSVPNMLGTFAMGIIFGCVLSYTNRIIYPFIIHFTVNASAVAISFFTTVSPIAESFYSDYIAVFLTVSVPLVIYLIKYIKANSTPQSYRDMYKHSYTTEFVFDIDEKNSIRIYEHDVRENNTAMAFRELVKSPYFYILLVIFIYFGGSVLW